MKSHFWSLSVWDGGRVTRGVISAQAEAAGVWLMRQFTERHYCSVSFICWITSWVGEEGDLLEQPSLRCRLRAGVSVRLMFLAALWGQKFAASLLGLSQVPRNLVSQFLKLVNRSVSLIPSPGIFWQNLTCGMRSPLVHAPFLVGGCALGPWPRCRPEQEPGPRRPPNAQGCASVSMQMGRWSHPVLQYDREAGIMMQQPLSPSPVARAKPVSQWPLGRRRNDLHSALELRFPVDEIIGLLEYIDGFYEDHCLLTQDVTMPQSKLWLFAHLIRPIGSN